MQHFSSSHYNIWFILKRKGQYEGNVAIINPLLYQLRPFHCNDNKLQVMSNAVVLQCDISRCGGNIWKIIIGTKWFITSCTLSGNSNFRLMWSINIAWFLYKLLCISQCKYLSCDLKKWPIFQQKQNFH